MGKTSAEEVVRTLASGLAQECREGAELYAAAIRGEPMKGACPFTGREIEVPGAPAIQRLREEIDKRGLAKDDVLMDAVRGALLASRRAGLFHLFAALDGEGELPEGMRLKLSTGEGVELNGWLHEIFGAS